jgi:hypothetical protein
LPAAAWKVPALQLEQLDAPVEAWKLPVAHKEHETTCWPAEYVPAMHFMHKLEASLKLPGKHTTGLQADEPTVLVSKP